MRESNFEMLRIICIWGIVSMHIYGILYGIAEGGNLIYGVLINSIFNTGVSLFMLISGYFGIRMSLKKVVNLELMILFYSILSWLIFSIVQGDWNIKEFIKSLLPVSTSQYWYITSYMVLLIFSDYINKIPEVLDKKSFEKLLLFMLIVFSVFPTIIQSHIMHDGGKGLVNMLLIYLVGRYIKKYMDKDMATKIWVGIGAIFFMLGFGLNLTLTLLKGGKGVYAPFARDCSIVIVITSISIFVFFKQLNIKSNVINRIAKHVVAIYLFEGAVRAIVEIFFDISTYRNEGYLFLIIAVYAIIVMTVCILLDVVRDFFMKYVERVILKLVKKMQVRLYNKYHNY